MNNSVIAKMSTCCKADAPKETDPVNLDDCYNLLISLIHSAGELALEGFNKMNKQTETKSGDWDLVTIYDKAVENLFMESIKKVYPNHLLVSIII